MLCCFFPLDHEASKVHFSTDVGLNTEINVKPTSGDSIDVRLGFLAEGHTYEVQFDIPNLLGGDLEVPGLQNPEIQIVNVRPIGESNIDMFFYIFSCMKCNLIFLVY